MTGKVWFIPDSIPIITILPSYFSFKTPSFPQFSMGADATVEIQIPIVYAMHNGLET